MGEYRYADNGDDGRLKRLWTHPTSFERSIANSPPTLVDCECRARVHVDGSGVEIDYCALHSQAFEMLACLKLLHPFAWTAELFDRIEAMIARADRAAL